MGKSTKILDFFKINNLKANTDDPSMPTSSVDISNSEILKKENRNQ